MLQKKTFYDEFVYYEKRVILMKKCYELRKECSPSHDPYRNMLLCNLKESFAFKT